MGMKQVSFNSSITSAIIFVGECDGGKVVRHPQCSFSWLCNTLLYLLGRYTVWDQCLHSCSRKNWRALAEDWEESHGELIAVNHVTVCWRECVDPPAAAWDNCAKLENTSLVVHEALAHRLERLTGFKIKNSKYGMTES